MEKVTCSPTASTSAQGPPTSAPREGAREHGREAVAGPSACGRIGQGIPYMHQPSRVRSDLGRRTAPARG
eukprot:3085569-Pyramimonas_sp.AAC.1